MNARKGAGPGSRPLDRGLPGGAAILPQGGVSFRVWAPERRKVEVVLEGASFSTSASIELAPERNGYFSGVFLEAGEGSLYRYRLDGGERFPDPFSRFQPSGPHGPSQVVDPSRFRWTDGAWPGLRPEGQIIYELHVGTFTPEGTWAAATAELPELVRCGVTVIEMMPVADFPGRFGWGYDGVNLFAPTRLYGAPDDLRRFVDAAHAQGLGVILDVVYNHLGPEGNYLHAFSSDYLSRRHRSEWGDTFNFDGENSGPVRDFVLANAAYWIREFHMDGLRLDATQCVCDNSPYHILAELSTVARRAAGGRSIYLVAENEPQRVQNVLPVERGGFGLDALWNDDFHHSARVALTGYNEAYYSEHVGRPQELISAVKRGYLYQGQSYFWQAQRRGTSTVGLPARSFIHFIQNHDQIANSAWGERIHRLTSPGTYRAMTALLLLGPQTPMLFQGQEFAASSPFLYFADLSPEVAKAVRSGRVEFLKQFTNITSPEIIDRLDDPGSEKTFLRSKLDPTERRSNGSLYRLHCDLLRLRREDPVFSDTGTWVDGAVLGDEAFVLRFLGPAGDRLLLVNLGRELRLRPIPEPLLAAPPGYRWKCLWSSEKPDYDGSGTPEIETDHCWRVLARAAVVLAPVEEEPARADTGAGSEWGGDAESEAGFTCEDVSVTGNRPGSS